LDRTISDVNREVAQIDERLAQLAQAQTPPPPALQPTAGGASIDVSVTPVLFQSIAISLDPAVQYDVIGEVRTESGEAAAGFRDRIENRKEAVFRVTLKAGRYSLKVLLRSLNDGRISTREINFEVK
jgi:hypothetical protein